VVDVPRRTRPETYLFFFAVIAAVVFLTHAPLIRLPFYWDELGQFIPASLDLFQTGSWVPYTTVPNIHPPGLMAYLAGFWSITGYSIPATRAAMLLMASVGAFFTFLLAIELGKDVTGFPAFTALLFLTLSPLFVAQSMMAQLDMPAMVFTALAFLLFVNGRLRSAALACVALTMMKETGTVVAAAFGLWLLIERRWKESLFFAAPLLPLGVWLVVLHKATGHWAGNAAFEQYNAVYNLNPARFTLALVRRLYYLFIGSGHWIGTAALIYAWKQTNIFRTRSWKVIGIFAAAHVIVVSAFGGAVLERYLMPLLPLLYIAFAVGLAACPMKWRLTGTLTLFPLLIAANFLNPLYPFPWENNLAFATFVSLDEKAVDFLENSYPGGTVATMFPLAGALRRPDFGYCTQPMRVRDMEDFSVKSIGALKKDMPDALAVYSTTWDPLHVLDNRLIGGMLTRFYGYEPQATREQILSVLHMHPVTRWQSRGQWVEIFESEAARPRSIVVRAATFRMDQDTRRLAPASVHP
jgi:4-amino-4-deoxy-L-arabinose transferase-like glycosyltransferase